MTEKEEKDRCQQIQEMILREMDCNNGISDEEILEYIEEQVLKMGHTVYLPVGKKQEMIRTIFNSIRKLDVLQEILEDNSITEIMVNGPNHIFIEREGSLLPYSKSFSSQSKLEDVVQQIVGKVNRRVNEANPIVDVRLLDGSRVNIVLPPVALEGPVVTIRKFPEQPISMDKLLEIGSITEEAAGFLMKLVQAKYNIFISGGTGSGKTTFLNALSEYIPSEERIIVIEDAAELQIRGIPNLVRLEVRNANIEGKNEITIRDLIKSALRMRPDRIILGEVRDAAACELLNVMNTGHDGSLCTGHANSPKDMLNRLETLVLIGMDIPLLAVRNQIASALGVLLIAETALRVSYRAALQLADDIAADPLHLRQFHGVMSPLCSKRPSGGGHTYPRQPAAQRSFHSLRNPAGYLCHLLNVLNLSVQHGPAAMLLFFNSQNLQPLFHYTARHADDAAGTDVQCVDQPLVLLFPLLGHSSHLIPALTKGYMDMASRSHGTPYPLCIRKWGNASTPVNQYLGPPKGLSLRLPSIKGSAEVSPQLSAVE